MKSEARLEWLVDAVEKLDVPAAPDAEMTQEQLVRGTVLFAQIALLAWMLDMEEQFKPVLLAGRLGAAVLKREKGEPAP